MNPAQAPVRPANAPTTASAQLDKKAASEAYKKVMRGEKLNASERTALKRYEKEQEETRRWQYYASIPQKHWRAMCGRQTKVLNEQAALYGIPFGGAKIDLPAVVRALHDFLAANARRLSGVGEDLMSGDASPALERFREERAAIARLERLEMERQLMPRAQVHDVLARVAGILRDSGQALQRQFGPAALEILTEAIDDAERTTERMLRPEGADDDAAIDHQPAG